MGKFVQDSVTIDRRIDSHEIRYQCDGAIFLCSTLRVEVFFFINYRKRCRSSIIFR